MTGFALTRATKESIKVALAISVSIVLALWFGWEKPYWAGITVAVVAANETYSHSVRKGRNRLMGTLLGISCAMVLLGFFPQQHLMFVLLYGTFLAVCVFLASHRKYGDAFTIAATVCALIAAMGSFDGATTFHVAILRIQETLLGLLVFSAVFRLLWPTKIEDGFYEVVGVAAGSLTQRIEDLATGKLTIDSTQNKQQKNNLSRLKDILGLPLGSSPKLHHEMSAWRIAIQAFELLENILQSPELNKTVEIVDIQQGKWLLDQLIESPIDHKRALQDWLDNMNSRYAIPKMEYIAFDLPVNGRLANVVRSLSIYFTGFALWWYVPLPGSFMVPMMTCVFANVLVTLPNQLFGQMVMGVIGWAAVFLVQYIFILPSFTEVWQLAGFYFINAFIVWRATAKPTQALQKVMGLNFLLVMTTSATYLTPNYSIVTAITMLTVIGICLSIGGFYLRLYRTL
ncbi:FUSC family protein [Vibrio breoganii]|uniref:FUSC family protein n=1 Tax=Vibrio breoganii TaxID=553239 RepID=UPI000360D735|nr:FUSC family protein [Vibrio breoganii]OEF81252.1 hypothetical protein B003_12770 [Vibrio breoganii 1C10]